MVTYKGFPTGTPDRQDNDLNVLSCWANPVPRHAVCVLLFYFLVTSKIIPWELQTCDSVNSRLLYSAVPLGDQTAHTMTWYPAQSHYHATESASPCRILVIPSTWIGSDKDFKCHWFDLTEFLLTPSSNLGSNNLQFCIAFVLLSLVLLSWPTTWEACLLLVWWSDRVGAMRSIE